MAAARSISNALDVGKSNADVNVYVGILDASEPSGV